MKESGLEGMGLGFVWNISLCKFGYVLLAFLVLGLFEFG
jgi:hypothetical protein